MTTLDFRSETLAARVNQSMAASGYGSPRAPRYMDNSLFFLRFFSFPLPPTIIFLIRVL